MNHYMVPQDNMIASEQTSLAQQHQCQDISNTVAKRLRRHLLLLPPTFRGPLLEGRSTALSFDTPPLAAISLLSKALECDAKCDPTKIGAASAFEVHRHRFVFVEFGTFST
jgi:hypothetical protein